MIYPGKCKIQPSGKEEAGRGKNENQEENKIEKFFLRASVGKEASAEKGGKVDSRVLFGTELSYDRSSDG